MIPALLTGALLAIVGLGLWIRALYQRGDRVPELTAALRTVADRRDEIARQLAASEANYRAAVDRGRTLAGLLSQLNTSLRRRTDAEIDAHPDDAPAQLAIADELLSRPWPGDPSRAAGDREGGAPGLRSAGGAAETVDLGRRESP